MGLFPLSWFSCCLVSACVAVAFLSSPYCLVCLHLNQMLLHILHAGQYLGGGGVGLLDTSVTTLSTGVGSIVGTMVGTGFCVGVYSGSWGG